MLLAKLNEDTQLYVLHQLDLFSLADVCSSNHTMYNLCQNDKILKTKLYKHFKTLNNAKEKTANVFLQLTLLNNHQIRFNYFSRNQENLNFLLPNELVINLPFESGSLFIGNNIVNNVVWEKNRRSEKEIQLNDYEIKQMMTMIFYYYPNIQVKTFY